MNNRVPGQSVLIFVWNNPPLITSCLKLGKTLSDLGYSPTFLLPGEENAHEISASGFKWVSLWDIIRKQDAMEMQELQRCIRVQDGQYFFKDVNLTTETWYEAECIGKGACVPLGCGSLEQLPIYAAVFLDVFNQLLDKYRPAACFAWNGLVYPPKALRTICAQRGIPIFSLERGLIPERLVIDPAGINYGGSLGGENWFKILSECGDRLDLASAGRYIAEFRNRKQSIVKHGSYLTKDEFYRKLGLPSSKRIILFPNQIDADTNILYYSPHYRTNVSVLQELVAASRQLSDAFIVVKSHPEDSAASLRGMDDILGQNGMIVSDVAVHCLIESAFAVVVRNSTVGLEGVLFGKPVVALGLSAYSGKGLTYDVSGCGELLQTLQRIWRDPDPDLPSPGNLEPFVSYLLTRYQYSLADDTTAADFNRRLIAGHLDCIRAKGIPLQGNGSSQVNAAKPAPLVSVIVPTHNRPDMLVAAIESILAQTMQSLEILVVNDTGSDVGYVLEKIEGKGKLRYLSHDVNRGLAAARNTGIRAARGKYIAYLDDDDTFYPEHLQTLVDFLENSEYRVAYTDAYRAVQERNNGSYITIRMETPYSSDFDYDRILSENFIPVLCVMHEKSCLDDCGFFDETLNRHEDWDLWIRMSRKHRFAHIGKITCEYTMRLDGTGMVSGSVPSFLRTFTRICDKYRHVTEGRPEIIEAQRQRRFQMMIDTYSFLGQRIDNAPDGKLGSPTEALLHGLRATGATDSEISSAFYQQAGIRALETPSIAAGLLRKALESDPTNVIARQKLAEALMRSGDFTGAGEELETLFGQNPREIHLVRTLAHFFSGRDDVKVARYLKLLLEMQPGSEEAVRLLRDAEERLSAQDAVSPVHSSSDSSTPLRIAVFSLDAREDACARIRLVAPLERLGKKVELLWGATSNGTTCSTNIDMIGSADLIIIQRFYPRQGTLPYIERMLASGKTVIYEADDLLLDIPNDNHLKPWAEETAVLLRTMLHRFSAITVSTPELGKAFSSFNRNVFVISNLVDEKSFVPATDKTKDRIVIGFTGTGTHANDLEKIEEAIFRIAGKYGDRVSFFFMGHASVRHSTLPGFTFREFRKDYGNYAKSLCESGIDIALVPLADNSFNRCKSNIKWLEYSACGIAGIYADLPPYDTSVEHGRTGLLVGQDPEKWFRAIEFLVENPALREEMARQARKKVLTEFSLAAGANRCLEIFRRIAGTKFLSTENPQETQSQDVAPQRRGKCDSQVLNNPSVHNGDSVACLPEKQAIMVSIIIPLYNQAAYTRQCLEALARNTGKTVPFELILVDDGSTDETADLLKGLTGCVTVISNKTNLGFARACNRGARLAEGRYLLFLNNDTVAQKGWLESLLDGIVKDGADICGAKLVYPDGRVQHAGVAFDERGIGYHIFKNFHRDCPEVNRKRFMQCVTGACMLISVKLFRELEGFDEQFLNGFEDVDLCLRAGAMGKNILYAPGSVLVHFEETSEGRKAHDDKNMRLFLSRWGGKIACDDEEIYRQEGYVKQRDANGNLVIAKAAAAPKMAGTDSGPADCGYVDLKALCERFDSAPDDRDNAVRLILGLKSAGFDDEARRVFSIIRQRNPQDVELNIIRDVCNG